MTDEINFTNELNQENIIKIYSKRAIWGFSIFFTPIFGGVLLRRNLIESNKKKEANVILLISIVFTVLTMLILYTVNATTSSLTYLLNLGWGTILSEYFFKKYFPNDDYEYKKIWKPLIISIALVILYVFVLLYTFTR